MHGRLHTYKTTAQLQKSKIQQHLQNYTTYTTAKMARLQTTIKVAATTTLQQLQTLLPTAKTTTPTNLQNYKTHTKLQAPHKSYIEFL